MTEHYGPKILTIDIETHPGLGYIWGLWQQNIGLKQIHTVIEMAGFAAKWHHKPGVMWYSIFHDGKDVMLQKAWDLLNEADIVVHFNGKSFDIKHIKRELALQGETARPYSPIQQVDLLLTAKKEFGFMSNKLDHLTQQFGIPGKLSTGGFELWLGTLANDPKAWAKMKRYCKNDVVITEKLYDRFLPWISGHPHIGLYTGEEHCCSNCGSTDLNREGFAYTNLAKRQRYSCNECGKWSVSRKSLVMVDERGVS